MPRILCISPYVPHPVTHGGGIRTRLLLESLHGLGQVHLAAPVTREQDRADAQYLADAEDLIAHELPAKADLSSGKIGKVAHWLRGESEMLARRWTQAAKSKVAELLRTYRFDLVVADGAHVLPVLPRIAAPLVFHMHNVESAILAREPSTKEPLQSRVTRRIEALRTARVERAALAAAAMSVTVSDRDREIALRLCPTARVISVPNAVNANLPAVGCAWTGGPIRLLFVGRLDYPPNLEAVTELVEQHLPALRDAFPGTTVRIVGEDSHGAAKGLQRQGVELLGRVSDLMPHYAQSHAAFVPLRSGGGTRLKILEAFALGLPVASTAVGSEGLAAQDSVHYRRFETPAEGVAALRDLLGANRDAYVRRAKELVSASYSHTASVTALRAACASAMAIAATASR